MRQTLILLALVFVSGCGSQQEAPKTSISPAEVRAPLDAWLVAYAKAEATKTHASGEHPAAEADMDRWAIALRDMKQRNEDAVKEVFSEVQARLEREEEEIVRERNQIQVLGRALTREERKYVDETAPRLLKEISAREKALHVLLKSLMN